MEMSIRRINHEYYAWKEIQTRKSGLYIVPFTDCCPCHTHACHVQLVQENHLRSWLMHFTLPATAWSPLLYDIQHGLEAWRWISGWENKWLEWRWNYLAISHPERNKIARIKRLKESHLCRSYHHRRMCKMMCQLRSRASYQIQHPKLNYECSRSLYYRQDLQSILL